MKQDYKPRENDTLFADIASVLGWAALLAYLAISIIGG